MITRAALWALAVVCVLSGLYAFQSAVVDYDYSCLAAGLGFVVGLLFVLIGLGIGAVLVMHP